MGNRNDAWSGCKPCSGGDTISLRDDSLPRHDHRRGPARLSTLAAEVQLIVRVSEGNRSRGPMQERHRLAMPSLTNPAPTPSSKCVRSRGMNNEIERTVVLRNGAHRALPSEECRESRQGRQQSHPPGVAKQPMIRGSRYEIIEQCAGCRSVQRRYLPAPALRQRAQNSRASRRGMPAVLFEHDGKVLTDEFGSGKPRARGQRATAAGRAPDPMRWSLPSSWKVPWK
jgi:hypothetical protein